MGCSLPGSSIHGIFQAKEYWSGVPLPSLTVLTDPELSLTRAVWGGGHWSHPAGEEGRTQRGYESCPSLPVSGEQSVFQGCLREPSCVCMCMCACVCVCVCVREGERTDRSLTASAELGPLECGVTCPTEGDGASLDRYRKAPSGQACQLAPGTDGRGRPNLDQCPWPLRQKYSQSREE